MFYDKPTTTPCSDIFLKIAALQRNTSKNRQRSIHSGVIAVPIQPNEVEGQESVVLKYFI